MLQKRINKLFLRWSLILITFSCFIPSAKGTHIAAADIYLDYLGSGPNNLKYRVTLVVIKACEPNNFLLGPYEIVTFTSSCATPFLRVLPMTVGPDTLHQLCKEFDSLNSCRKPGSIWPAYERRVYSDTVTLPIACQDWRVQTRLCARNGGIMNLVNPLTTCIFVEAGLNNIAKWNNSTPRFTVDPIPFVCLGQPISFLNSPLDPDNDSMHTINVAPLDSFNIPIAFQAPYTNLNPFDSPSGYTVDQNTGTANFTPITQGKYVIAFKCTDYDKITGTMLSYTRRDVQVAVLNCNGSPPDIDSVPVGLTGATWVPTLPNGGYILVCAGSPISFNVSGLSTISSNSVYLLSDNFTIVPASSFSVSNQGSNNPVGKFQWTPSNLDIGSYTIIFTAIDSTCNNNQPVLLRNHLVVFIKVLANIDAGPDGRICKTDGVPWQFNVSGPPTKYIWSDLDGSNPIGLSNDTIPNPTAYPPYNFTYVVTAPYMTGCKNRDTVQVYIDTSNSLIASPHEAILCRPGYVSLNAQGIGFPPLENLVCGTQNVKQCTVEDTLEIRSQYSGNVVTQSTISSPFPAGRTGRLQFLLTKADLSTYGIRAGTIEGLAFDIVTPPDPASYQYNNFTLSLKCTDRKTLSTATGSFENGMIQVYAAAAPVTVNKGWNQFNFDKPYNLDSTKSLIVEICYTNTAPAINAAIANVVFTNSQQTVYTYANLGLAGVCQNPSIGVNTQYAISRPTVRLNYCPSDTADFQYTWYPGTYLSDSSSGNPLAYIPATSKYYVTTVGRNGCKVLDSVLIVIPVHLYDVWPKDTSICLGDSFKMVATGDFTSINWFETDAYINPLTLNCDSCRTPIASPKLSTLYKVIMTDKDGCSDTMTVRVKVKPLPNVLILTADAKIKYGRSVKLLASGAFLYSWQPASSLTNPNIINPVAAPTEPTTYYVWGLGENGCRNVDSTHIDVDYRDNLFVPSAFSPNGDGKNDQFRVANITFQRLQEFRIFNRWGQEIYRTTDVRKGWDGSWKGVPQDIGVYQYLIRVAYPDGYAETYKGNVSLIR